MVTNLIFYGLFRVTQNFFIQPFPTAQIRKFFIKTGAVMTAALILFGLWGFIAMAQVDFLWYSKEGRFPSYNTACVEVRQEAYQNNCYQG